MHFLFATNRKESSKIASLKTMKHFSFDAHLYVNTAPCELIVFGSVFTERIDDQIELEIAASGHIIETDLLLQLKIIKGVEAAEGNIKPFVFNLNHTSNIPFNKVTILYGHGESKTTIVKIV
jgi:hypothetical protein